MERVINWGRIKGRVIELTLLFRVSDSPIRYERQLTDGTREVYGHVATSGASRRIFLTGIIDPMGDQVSLGYDSNNRLITITDAVGQVTTLCYALDDCQGNPTSYLIRKVTDPFGRSATFSYDTSNRLVEIVDVAGMASSFTYNGGDFITSLTTPYGTTTFEKEPANTVTSDSRWVQATDPLGEKERIEFIRESDLISGTVPANQLPAAGTIGVANITMNMRNTYYWGRKAMKDAPDTPRC